MSSSTYDQDLHAKKLQAETDKLIAESKKVDPELAKLRADRRRIDAEAAKLRAEARKAQAEADKLRAENGDKLSAEVARLLAETALLNTRRWWHPLAIGAAFATTLMAATYTITKLLG